MHTCAPKLYFMFFHHSRPKACSSTAKQNPDDRKPHHCRSPLQSLTPPLKTQPVYHPPTHPTAKNDLPTKFLDEYIHRPRHRKCARVAPLRVLLPWDTQSARGIYGLHVCTYACNGFDEATPPDFHTPGESVKSSLGALSLSLSHHPCDKKKQTQIRSIFVLSLCALYRQKSLGYTAPATRLAPTGPAKILQSPTRAPIFPAGGITAATAPNQAKKSWVGRRPRNSTGKPRDIRGGKTPKGINQRDGRAPDARATDSPTITSPLVIFSKYQP